MKQTKKISAAPPKKSELGCQTSDEPSQDACISALKHKHSHTTPKRKDGESRSLAEVTQS